MLSELLVAMEQKLPFTKLGLADVVHPYPTYSWATSILASDVQVRCTLSSWGTVDSDARGQYVKQLGDCICIRLAHATSILACNVQVPHASIGVADIADVETHRHR